MNITTVKCNFPRTVDVFNKIAVTPHETSDGLAGSNVERFRVSEKQWLWLIGVYCKEGGLWDGVHSAGVTDDMGVQYSFSPTPLHNAPRYIPDRRKYGVYYIVTKITPQSLTKTIEI